MAESTSDKSYEEEFEYPLLKMIKQKAEEKDISYSAASKLVLPEYIKTIRYRDKEYEESVWAAQVEKGDVFGKEPLKERPSS